MLSLIKNHTIPAECLECQANHSRVNMKAVRYDFTADMTVEHGADNRRVTVAERGHGVIKMRCLPGTLFNCGYGFLIGSTGVCNGNTDFILQFTDEFHTAVQLGCDCYNSNILSCFPDSVSGTLQHQDCADSHRSVLLFSLG